MWRPWCGISPSRCSPPTLFTLHPSLYWRLAPPSKSEVEPPPHPTPIHFTLYVTLKTGSFIQVWRHHGVGPVNHLSSCFCCHVIEDWLVHPSLDITMAWDLSIITLHASSVTLLKTGSSIQVWCHHVWASHLSLFRLRLSPYWRLVPSSKSDVTMAWYLFIITLHASFVILLWLLYPSLILSWCGTSSVSLFMLHLSSYCGCSILVWCHCGRVPPCQYSPCFIHHISEDWLLHLSALLPWCGTYPLPLFRLNTILLLKIHTSPLLKTSFSIQVWCHHNVEPPCQPFFYASSVTSPYWGLVLPSESDITEAWNLPTNHLHASSITVLRASSSIQVWYHWGMEPTHQPSSHFINHLTEG